jgi:general secretion pathway protein D
MQQVLASLTWQPAKINTMAKPLVLVMACLLLGSCAAFQQHEQRIGGEEKVIDQSFLTNLEDSPANEGSLPSDDDSDSPSGFTSLINLPPGTSSTLVEAKEIDRFSTTRELTVNVNEMPVVDFLHYAMGDLLGINYVLDEQVKSAKPAVTLSLRETTSKRDLYVLVGQLLNERGLDIEVNEGVYYVHKTDRDNKGAVRVSVGRSIDSVPSVGSEILQVVPLRYGANLSLERTLRELLDLTITVDVTQNAVFMRGTRREIIKALGFVEMFDAPANRGRHVGLIYLTYVESESFSEQLQQLMEAEGIPISIGAKTGNNVALVPLPQLGATAIFASSGQLLDRVRYWASVLDKPVKGAGEQYFVFRPQFARAVDVGASIAALLGSPSTNMGGGATPSTGGGERTGSAPSEQRVTSVTIDGLRMVVDERSNTLVFVTSGSKYQTIEPLLNQLDILPKQVVLDMVIAEVTLKDEFRFGFEFALQDGDAAITTLGAYGAGSIGGAAMQVVGVDGELTGQILQTSSLINVLSNPTLLVRDGVQASISVGSDISVVGATTFDPINGERQTTTAQYRQTGVSVSVMPTINAEGIVLMQISQDISNAVPGSTGAGGNPDVFTRSVTTEIAAASGQTVLLGGLISEDVSASKNGAPGLSKVPGLGWLFKTEGDNSSRTELVMLITPRILDSVDEWEQIKDLFSDGLNYIDLETP